MSRRLLRSISSGRCRTGRGLNSTIGFVLSYPPQALSCLLAALPAPPRRCRVVDVGAGTGKLTAVLAQAGVDVDAVESDSGMRTVLTERLPAIRVHAGRGEKLPLGDGRVDAVVYGNSWHWVDDAAGSSAARAAAEGFVHPRTGL